MKKVFKVLTTLFVLIGLTACNNAVQSGASVSTNPGNGGGSSNGGGSNGGGGSNPNLDIPTTVHIDNMFASKVAVGYPTAEAHRAIAPETDNNHLETLTYFDGTTNKPYIFKNGKGDYFLLGVTKVVKISEGILGIRYKAVYPLKDFSNGRYIIDKDNIPYPREAILNLETGVLWDNQSYNLNGMQYYAGKLYGCGKYNASSLYEIDSTNLNSMIQLNKIYNKPHITPNYNNNGQGSYISGQVYAYMDNFFVYKDKHVIMFKEERERNHVNELNGPFSNTGDFPDGGIINSLTPRIYVTDTDPKEEYIAWDRPNIAGEQKNKPNIVCFIQEKVNDPIYVIYENAEKKLGVGTLNISLVNESGNKIEGDGAPGRPSNKTKGFENFSSYYFKWEIEPKSSSTVKSFVRTVIKPEANGEQGQYYYPCFYARCVDGDNNAANDRYIQNPTHFYHTDKVRIIEHMNDDNTVKASPRMVEISINNGNPSITEGNTLTKINRIPWKNYESVLTNEMLNGTWYFEDTAEIIGNDVIYQQGDAIYKNGTKISKRAIPTNDGKKYFNILNNSVVIRDGKESYTVPISGGESKALADYDIGLNNLVYFDKPIDATQSSLNATASDPKDLENKKKFEDELGTSTWKATADICKKGNPGIPIPYDKIPLPKFTIKDPSKNKAELALYTGGDEKSVVMPSSETHYEITNEKGVKNPLLKLVCGEDCRFFKLEYKGKSTIGEKEVINLVIDLEGQKIPYTMEKITSSALQ